MGTAPWRALTAALEMGRMTASCAFLITTFTNFKSGATGKNFIVRLTTFSVNELHLSLDYEFPLENFNGA